MASLSSHDDSALVNAVDELVALLVAEEPLETVMDRVVAFACAGIDGCDLASVTYMRDGKPETIACTDEVANEIDQAQYGADDGPCLQAFRTQQVISVPSMVAEDRWVEFRDAAQERGVHSSFSLWLAAGPQPVGALNLYSRQDHGFSSVPSESARQFAKQAAVAIWSAGTAARARALIANLQIAVEGRDLIGMAKGVIMANEKVTPDQAFAILRTVSQQRNVKVRDLASDIVATGVTPA